MSWIETDHRDGQIATCEFGEHFIRVQNLDDDQSEFRIIGPDGNVHANGSCASGDHFEACKQAAWLMLLQMPITEYREP